MNSNYCVCCGSEIPEGKQVCLECESRPMRIFCKDDNEIKELKLLKNKIEGEKK